ncbi:DinB family protein [Brunnivagina elsteri]|uniref:Damage-inducible protein DinB n=1 Tax=Brunnivagina elsteri CCALA 953 TaxID=987040 RepID=A0A2A2TCF1_9CYAN|nr:DinB family protein [Calothrix elsteri]PAX51381.1 damage-inducible protein DinB [Calothrix elsteri CCALA 953]
MTVLKQIQLMAQYNQWINQRIYQVAKQLPDEKLAEDKKAFFCSILGTLNHIMVADIVWLKRFSKHPSHHVSLNYIRQLEQPENLNQVLYVDFDILTQKRLEFDAVIIEWCQEITDNDLSFMLPYNNMKGEPSVKEFGSLLFHFFNHQTHHRGQVTTLLSQENIDIGVTDLLMLIPNESN